MRNFRVFDSKWKICLPSFLPSSSSSRRPKKVFLLRACFASFPISPVLMHSSCVSVGLCLQLYLASCYSEILNSSPHSFLLTDAYAFGINFEANRNFSESIYTRWVIWVYIALEWSCSPRLACVLFFFFLVARRWDRRRQSQSQTCLSPQSAHSERRKQITKRQSIDDHDDVD